MKTGQRLVRLEAYVTLAVSIKDQFLEPFLFMLNACLSLSWLGLEIDHKDK
jgi:hypothetical protein